MDCDSYYLIVNRSSEILSKNHVFHFLHRGHAFAIRNAFLVVNKSLIGKKLKVFKDKDSIRRELLRSNIEYKGYYAD